MPSTDTRFDRLQALADRIVGEERSPFHTPGLAIITTRRDGSGERVFAGADAAGNGVREDTLFPIASASKLATGLAVLRLVDQRLIDLDAPLGRYLPEARAAEDGVTIRRLFSHTSGLPQEVDPGLAPYTLDLDWERLRNAALQTGLESAPGTRVHYSNVGYDLLSAAAEQVSGTTILDLLERTVFGPLAVEAYIGREPPRRPAVVGGIDSRYVGTELEPYNSAFIRGWLSPANGIYTTADGLLAMLQVYDNRRPDLIRPETIAEARSNQAAGLGGGFGTTTPFLGFNSARSITWRECAWGLGVELRGEKRPHWTPPGAAPESFGQIGASGCLAWCDPQRGASWVILGPRTTDNGWILRHGTAIGTVALQRPGDEG